MKQLCQERTMKLVIIRQGWTDTFSPRKLCYQCSGDIISKTEPQEGLSIEEKGMTPWKCFHISSTLHSAPRPLDSQLQDFGFVCGLSINTPMTWGDGSYSSQNKTYRSYVPCHISTAPQPLPSWAPSVLWIISEAGCCYRHSSRLRKLRLRDFK